MNFTCASTDTRMAKTKNWSILCPGRGTLQREVKSHLPRPNRQRKKGHKDDRQEKPQRPQQLFTHRHNNDSNNQNVNPRCGSHACKRRGHQINDGICYFIFDLTQNISEI